MKFSLRQLQVFDQVAEHQSVTVAARELNMSQSAVSMALGQLEELLGKPLFLRQGRQMSLNDWGSWLRPQVLQILSQCRTIELGMDQMNIVSGQLALGASQTPAEYLVPALLSDLDQAYPKLEVTLGVENTEHIIDGLLDYRYDLGIIEGYCDDERITQASLCEDELVIIAGAHHPLSSRAKIRLDDLEKARWVLRERGAGTRDIFNHSIHKHIKKIRVHREFDQVDVILAMVRQGEYLSCLSERVVKGALDAGWLKILKCPPLSMTREFRFIWRKEDTSHVLKQLVMDAAQEVSLPRLQGLFEG